MDNDKAKTEELLRKTYRIAEKNARGLQENMQSIQQVGGRVLRPNSGFTTGALKVAKLGRLEPGVKELENLVRNHGGEGTQKILGLVKQTTEDEAKELLELWDLWKNKDAASARTWANNLKGANTGAANELAEIWGDMKNSKNKPAIAIAVFLRRLDDTRDSKHLDLLRALSNE